MSYYLSRDLIRERLKLGLSQSYRLIGTAYGSLISSDEVLELLNQSRRGIIDPITNIPSDLVTADELANDEALNNVVSPKKLITWTRRIKNIPPHFRLNSHTTRFSKQLFFDWLKKRSKIKRIA